MLLQSARLPARTDQGGDLLLLEKQDRSLWNRTRISDGLRHLDQSAQGADVTTYHLEAGIAACHAIAASYRRDRLVAHSRALRSAYRHQSLASRGP